MKLSNKDIILQDNKALFYFRYLPWDAEFFGQPSYSLDVEVSNLTPAPAIADLIETQLCGTFVTAKVDTSMDQSIILLLMQSGFQYIDTEVILECRCIPDLSIARNNILITNLKNNANLPYERLGSVYSLTRFHTDPHIKPAKADQLWINYLKNYIPDDRHQIFAATVEEEVSGVVLVDVHDTSTRLSFVSVRQRYRGRGIGSLLIREVIAMFKETCITVGTQIKNIKALNFYIRNGFSKIRHTKTILHRW